MSEPPATGIETAALLANALPPNVVAFTVTDVRARTFP
jgi:hypothetical protein